MIELLHTITDPLTPAAADPDKSEKSTYDLAGIMGKGFVYPRTHTHLCWDQRSKPQTAAAAARMTCAATLL